MSRERIAWMVSIILLAVLAMNLPGSLAERDDDFAWVRTLVEVHRQVLNNYVEPVNDNELREKAIDGMLSDLDPFTDYIPPDLQEKFDQLLDGTFKGVGITLDAEDGKMTVVTPIEGSPADLAGIEAGDEVIKVNGESIVGLPIDQVVKKVTGPVHTPVTLTILRDGKSLDFTMMRKQLVVSTVKGYARNRDDSWNYFVSQHPKIGYVRITQFDTNDSTNTYDELREALITGRAATANQPATKGLIDQGLQGLILDLRFNPGGRLEQAVKVVNMFIRDGKIVTTRGRNRPEQIERANGDGTLLNFPLIVLINDKSASAAEIVSGSLKDNGRALIVGARSYGKGSVQELMPLDDNGGELKLTVAYYYLPSGRLVHRRKNATDWGVEPQIIVPMDDDTSELLRIEMEDRDIIRRNAATLAAATRPATRASTHPTTMPIDTQLDTAIDTMSSAIEHHGGKLPITQAATQPSTTVSSTRIAG